MSNFKRNVLAEFTGMTEAIKSGIIPSSSSKTVVEATKNSPYDIVQHTMGGPTNGEFTTIQLSPNANVNYLANQFNNLVFAEKHDFRINVSDLNLTDPGSDKYYYLYVPYWFFIRDPASLPSRLDFMIESQTLHSTTYQRQESAIAFASLPETEVRSNPEYTTLRKLMEGKKCPAVRCIGKFKITHDNYNSTGYLSAEEVTTTCNFNVTQDINRLHVMFSNQDYVVPQEGNLQIREYFNNMERAFFFCPDYNWRSVPATAPTITAGSSDTSAASKTSVEGLVSYLGRSFVQPQNTQYWSFYALSDYHSQEISGSKIPFYAWIGNTAGTNATLDEGMCLILTSVRFDNPTTGDFFGFKQAPGGCMQSCQQNFMMVKSEYEALTAMFAANKAIVLPTNVFMSNAFTNGTYQQNQWSQYLNGTISGYNVDFLSIWFQTGKEGASFCWEPLTQFQCQVNGIPTSALSYPFINARFITDSIQCLIDPDHEEINEDYINSLTLWNETGTPDYMDISPYKKYGLGSGISATRHAPILNPNLCFYNFSTNIPDSFHTGWLNFESKPADSALLFISQQSSSAHLNEGRSLFPHWINNKNVGSEGELCGFSAFCDVCFILRFDEMRNKAFNGTMAWAAPYADSE